MGENPLIEMDGEELAAAVADGVCRAFLIDELFISEAIRSGVIEALGNWPACRICETRVDPDSKTTVQGKNRGGEWSWWHRQCLESFEAEK